MNGRDRSEGAAGSPGGRARGGATAATGTPFAVDLSGDRQARIGWVPFVGGPVVWFAHFVVVYMVAEAGCTGGGHGLELFDAPVPRIVTLVATVVAVVACLALAAWAHRRWRARSQAPDSEGEPGATGAAVTRSGPGEADDRGDIAFAGLLLSLLSAVAVLLVGVPAPFLAPC